MSKAKQTKTEPTQKSEVLSSEPPVIDLTKPVDAAMDKPPVENTEEENTEEGANTLGDINQLIDESYNRGLMAGRDEGLKYAILRIEGKLGSMNNINTVAVRQLRGFLENLASTPVNEIK